MRICRIHIPSFPRRRESNPPSPVAPISAETAGTARIHIPSFPRRRAFNPPVCLRTNLRRQSRNCRIHAPSFPRRRESKPPSPVAPTSTEKADLPHPHTVFPAQTGIQTHVLPPPNHRNRATERLSADSWPLSTTVASLYHSCYDVDISYAIADSLLPASTHCEFPKCYILLRNVTPLRERGPSRAFRRDDRRTCRSIPYRSIH